MVEVSPLVGRTPKVSAAAYTGRAVAPAQPDPVTTGLINKNSLQLAVVSSQIQGMAAQMNSLAGSLQVVASSLATTQAIERQKEAQEQELERRLAEQKLREGKESVIERKIQAAAIAPAQKLAGTAQFTLGRLGQFFTSLLGGWLLVKGVETLKALSEGNNEKLNDIKNNVLKNLGLITGIFIGYKGGLALLTTAFSRVGGRLLAVAAAGLFVKPFADFIKFITSAATDVVKQIPGLNSLLPEEEPEIDSSAPPTAENIEAGQAPPEAPAATENPPASSNQANLEGTGGPSLVTPTETMMGDKVDPQLQELKNDRAAILYDFRSGIISREEYESETAELTKKIDEFGSANQAEVTAQPQETALGKPTEEKESEEVDASKPAEYGNTSMSAESVSPVEGDETKQTQPGQLKEGSKSLLEVAFDSEAKSFIDAEKYIGKTGKLPVEEMFSPVKKDAKVAEKVGPAPEPPVNVVPIPSDQGAAKPEPVPAGMGPINNAPSFATSNSDNIYILGAMSNFNVVMA